MASIATSRPEASSWKGPWHRFVPAEGWSIVLLHVIIILIATWSVQSAGWSDDAELLPIVAVAASLFGFVLAKSAAIDLLAHLLALWTGVAAVLLWIASTPSFAELGPGWRTRLSAFAERASAWLQLSAQGEPRDDRYLFLGLLALSVWLVAYMSAWTLYRRQWVAAAVGLPAVVALCNSGYRQGTSGLGLAAMLVAGIMLVALHFHYQRRVAWEKDEILGGYRVQWRIVGVAAQIGMVALLGAWLAPNGVRDQTLNQIGNRLEQPVDRLENWTGDVFSRFGGSSAPRSRSYAQFSDSFELGGALDLSDDPIVVLDADASSYLVAYRYDRWDGSGWQSAVERTFSGRNVDGKRYSPQMRFAPNQPVALSDEVKTERAPVSGDLTLIESDNNLLMTLDTFQAAEVPTTVQLSWRTLDNARLPINEPGTLPPDLRHLAILMDEANAAGFIPGTNPAVTGQQELDDSLLKEKAQLSERLIQVGWEVNASGRVEAMMVSGQLPVYDDVEAVFAKDDPTGTTYAVTGLASLASADQLRQAGQDYPAYVQDRYLQQSSTTTARTRALTIAIVQEAGANNPFDQAVSIQNDLRQRIRYNERIATPPRDRDLVDYVLFDSQEGYCEYYASAMAVMLRTLGIPSRIAVGYYPATYDEQYGGYLYRQRNAHAWVEAFFPAYGWIPFEPTASQPVREYGDDGLAGLSQQPSPAPEIESTPTPEAVPTATPQIAPPAVTTDDSSSESGGDFGRWAVRGVVGFLAVFLGLAGLVWMMWRHGLRGLSATDALWARVLKAGRWAGIRAEPSMTPLEYADEIGRAVPAAQGPASRVASLYTVRRYGTIEESNDAGDAGGEWREIRRSLTRAWAKRRLLRRR